MTGLLKLVALGASVVILLSFGAFASDRTGEGRQEQIAKVDRELTSGTEQAPQEKHGAVRRKLDDGKEARPTPNMDSPAPYFGKFSAGKGKPDGQTKKKNADKAEKPKAGGSIESRGVWVSTRIVAGFLGLLVYGLGLSLFANYIRPRRRRPGGSFSEPPPDFVPYR